MKEIGCIEEFSYSEFVNYVRSILMYYREDKEEMYEEVTRDIAILEERLRDDNLYLGVIGGFSSGKSTFINSVIHKNLLPASAVQGTTVTASILQRADVEDLEITYLNGTSKLFSDCYGQLLDKYQVESKLREKKQRSSIFLKFKIWFRKLLRHIFKKQFTVEWKKARIDLYKKLIATEEFAKDIQYVTLYYQNDNIPYKISMVDTPGTGSLNQRHDVVTRMAIDDLCDAVVVVIPCTSPASEELLDYINLHLKNRIQECIFVVTKIESLDDKDELPELIKDIEERLKNGLATDVVRVIPMPTLIYLKNVDMEWKTTYLDEMSTADKEEMVRMYERGIGEINDFLNAQRSTFIEKKIQDICERVIQRLNSDLLTVVAECENQSGQLQSRKVRSVDWFSEKAERKIIQCKDTLLQTREKQKEFVNLAFSRFRTEMEKEIDESVDSKDLISRICFEIEPVLTELSCDYMNQLEKSKERYVLKLQELHKEFQKEYSKCGAVCLLSNMREDDSIVYSQGTIWEWEAIFQKKVEEVQEQIKKDTSGILKKVKNFFGDSLKKHKEMAISQLFEAVDELYEKVMNYSADKYEVEIETLGNEAISLIRTMVNNDRQVISAYIKETNKLIGNSNKEKERTQKYINGLNKYMSIIKEVEGKNER